MKTFSTESVLRGKQYPSLEGLKTILATEAKGKPGQAREFVRLTFIRELDQSGYIDGCIRRNKRFSKNTTAETTAKNS